jgi:hypothetical protein
MINNESRNPNEDVFRATSPVGGRRRGDAILIAFNHAYEEGDIDVAAQLLVEYQTISQSSSLLLNVERRRKHDYLAVISRLWAMLRHKAS